ncbi:glycosyltransferase family 39 protein [candidate division WOR-3 bacterium]|nr:glycosyltransferase family 39 protein [candidate division WOR-3 bacterium]
MAKKKKLKKTVSHENGKSKFTLFFKKRKRRIIYLLLSVGGILSLLLFEPKLGTGGDNALYIILAKSLTSGQGFRNIHFPDNSAHTYVPPGYPTLLSPLISVFPDTFIPLKFLSIAFFMGSIFLCYQLFQKYTKSFIAFIATLLIAIAPNLLSLSSTILTEIPCLFFILLSLFLFEKSFARKPKTFIYFLGGTLSMMLSYYIRPASMALILASLIYFLYRKEYKRLIYLFIIIVLLALPWYLRNKFIVSQVNNQFSTFLLKNPYNPELGCITLSDLITRILENIKMYIYFILPGIILPSLNKIRSAGIHIFGGIFFAGVIIYGMAKETLRQKKLNLCIIFFIFHCGIILIWPKVWSGDRFLVSIIPFIFLYLIFGIRNLGEKVSVKLFYPLGFIFLGLILLSNFWFIIPRIPVNLTNLSAYLDGDTMHGYSKDWIRFYEASSWIKANTPSDAIVMSRKRRLFYLHSNRNSVIYPFSYDHSKIFSSIYEQNTDYIIVDHFFWTGTTRRYLTPVLNEHLDNFKVVYVTEPPKTFVLKVIKNANK